jgi:hypothetical protein
MPFLAFLVSIRFSRLPASLLPSRAAVSLDGFKGGSAAARRLASEKTELASKAERLASNVRELEPVLMLAFSWA